MSHVLSMWTIYDHPSDYPKSFVARRWDVGAGGVARTERILISDTVEWIRDQMQEMGLTRLVRSEGDDPCIMETWI
jgi:hypothetical protein